MSTVRSMHITPHSTAPEPQAALKLRRPALSSLAGFLGGLAIIGLAAEELRFLQLDGATLVPSWIPYVALVIAAALSVSLWRAGTTGIVENSLWGSLGAFGVWLASDMFDRRFGFYVQPLDRYDVLVIGALFAAAAMTIRSSRWLNTVLSIPTAIVIQVFLLGTLLRAANGRMIFSDDHPSFLYRLQLLGAHFPSVPFYNTDWNAGYVARELLSTAVLNVFLTGFPLSLMFGSTGPDSLAASGVYSYLVAYLFLVLMPLALGAAGWLFTRDMQTAVLTAILGVGATLGFYEWLLKYGTLGFCVATFLYPLAIGLAYRLFLAREQPQVLMVGAFLVVSSLVLMWLPSVFGFVPLAVVFCFSGMWISRFRILIVSLLGMLLLNAFWLVPFLREVPLAHFIAGSSLATSSVPHAAKEDSKPVAVKENHPPTSAKFVGSLSRFREQLVRINPIVLIFFLPGIALLPDRRLRAIFALSVLWLSLAAIVGEALKPQLELRRMVIILSIILVVPTALALTTLARMVLESHAGVRRVAAVCGAILLFGGIAATPMNVAAVYAGRGDDTFIFEPPVVADLSELIREHGGDGRTFFFGFILHELGAGTFDSQDGGHIAPLSYFSGKELYASFPYHGRWTVTDPIPREFRKRGSKGIEEFLDLLNVTATISFNGIWRKYCESQPNYSLVGQTGRFRVWKRTPNSPGFILEGKGTARRIDRATLEVVPESEELVLKYRYNGNLEVVPKGVAELSGKEVFLDELGGEKRDPFLFVTLRVSPAAREAKTPIRIRYRPLF